MGIAFNYLSNSSMVIDNLRNVQMVLASGEIVQANEQENADLFWGVRGTCLLTTGAKDDRRRW